MPETFSRNFAFLRDCDPLLDEYGFRAEQAACDDPNTSLIKTRQFGELLAQHVAAHAGMDCTDEADDFDGTIRLLRRQRLIPRSVASRFDSVRLYGNAAAHKHNDDATDALLALEEALELANWFQEKVRRDSDFKPSRFIPPLKPEDATADLKEEIDSLRVELARSILEANASEEQVRKSSEKLEREQREYEADARQMEAELARREHDLDRLKRESDARLRQVAAAADSKTFQGWVERSEDSARRVGMANTSQLPLMQLRITTGERSSCCGAPVFVVQSMSGGFVSKNCAECDKKSTVSRREFEGLHVCVLCAECGGIAAPAMLAHNYGFRCGCGWECELAALVAHYADR